MKTFARLLMAAMKQKNMSQNVLADRVSRSRQRINQILNGDVPPPDLASRLAIALGENPAEWSSIAQSELISKKYPDGAKFHQIAMDNVVDYAAPQIAQSLNIKLKEVSMPHLSLDEVSQTHPKAFISENPRQSVITATHIVCAAVKKIPAGTPCLVIPKEGLPRVVLYDASLDALGIVYRVLGGYSDYMG